MRQVIKHRDIRLLKKIRRTDPVIPSALWNQIPGLGSIPQYYLYDRQGKRVWENTGFSNEVLEIIGKEIEKALK